MISCKLPRECRLSGGSNYTGHFDSKTRSKHFIILSRKNSAFTSRIGVSLSKKYIPLAVTRSVLRRQIKESFRRKKSKIESLDVVVRATQKIVKLNLRDARAELDRLLSHI